MDYKKKYEEALENIKRIKAANKDNKELVDFIEYKYPELKESEDEKIRKEIVEIFKAAQRDGICEPIKKEQFEKIFAWLENVYTEDDINRAYKCADEVQYRMGYEAAKKEIEKQDEQKVIDNVEPKFKVGDWITNDEYTWKVTDIKPLDYILQSQNGDVVDDVIFYVDEEFHLWTIQDAKDGDVLVDNYGNVVIYQELSTNLMYHSYCYANKTHFINTGGSHTISNTYPATKEQCDLLFAKMKEAGYLWDDEKKELRKIEQENSELPNGEDYGIDSLYHAARILEKTLGDVEGYQSDDGILEHKCAIEAVNRLYKQKPTWSEEDERMINSIIKNLDEGEWFDIYQTDWLKSLKEKYTWKPNLLSDIISGCNKGEFSQFEYSLINFAMACSDKYINMTPKGIHCYAQTSLNEAKKEIKLTEEDEKTVHLACEFIRHHSKSIDSIGGIDCSTLIERLKSLRPQTAWKPSDEQMKQLGWVAEQNKDNMIGKELITLYNDLKKLKEE